MRTEPIRVRPWYRRLPHVSMVLVLLVAALLTTAANLLLDPPQNLIRSYLSAQFESATGLRLVLAPESRVTLWPEPHLVLENVEVIRPAASARERPGVLMVAERVTLTLDRDAALSGNLVITEAELHNPTAQLVAGDLRRWQNLRAQRAGARPAGSVRIDMLRINGGALDYIQAGPNPLIRVSEIDGAVANVTPRGIEAVTANVRWRETLFAVNGALELDTEAGTRLQMEADGAPVTASFDGALQTPTKAGGGEAAASAAATPRETGAVQGRITLNTGDIAEVLRLLNIAPRTFLATGPATLDGTIETDLSTTGHFKGAVTSTIATGDFDGALNVSGDRPKFTGSARWKELDISPLVATQTGARSLTVASRDVLTGVELPSTADELISFLDRVQAGPGATLRTAENETPRRRSLIDWSKRQLGLSSLKSFDMDMAHDIVKFRADRTELDNVDARVSVDNGVLDLTVGAADLGETKVSGTLGIDARIEPAHVALKSSATRLDVEALLRSMFGSAKLRGRGAVELDITGRGDSLSDIVGSVSGKAGIAITQGRIVGFDLQAMISRWWRKWRYDDDRGTDFDRIAADFRLKNGILHTVGPAQLRGDRVEIDADGTVSLRRREIDQRVKLRLSPPPQRLQVPLRISGLWSAPKINLDFESFYRFPGLYALPHEAGAGDAEVPPELRARIEAALADPAIVRELPHDLARSLRALVNRR